MLGVIVARHQHGAPMFYLNIPVSKSQAAPVAFTLRRDSYRHDPNFLGLVTGVNIVVREIFHPEATAAEIVFNGFCFYLGVPTEHYMYYIDTVLRILKSGFGVKTMHVVVIEEHFRYPERLVLQSLGAVLAANLETAKDAIGIL